MAFSFRVIGGGERGRKCGRRCDIRPKLEKKAKSPVLKTKTTVIVLGDSVFSGHSRSRARKE